MSYNYIILILIIIGILGGYGFWRLIKHYNYEINFKESILYSIYILILTFSCLFDFSLMHIYINFNILIGIIIYFIV